MTQPIAPATPGPDRDGLAPLLTSPWFLALVVWLAFFWRLGAVALYDLDEGAFAEATREMLASGNFITPFRDGQPRYDKPVLIYWAQAAAVATLGLTEFALRLPSAIAASLWLVALWRFVRAHLDAVTAGLAALVMALSLQVGLIAQAAVADALLNLFIALSFFDIYRYRQRPRPGLLLRVYLWLGLGFLTKGPVAVVLPLLVSFAWFASLRDLGTWWRAVTAPRGWLVWLAVVLPWHVAILLDNGWGFFQGFFLEHNLHRFAGVKHGHSGFPGYYFVMILLVLLPFTGWFLRLLPRLRLLWADPLERFLLLWFVVVFTLFSLAETKLPHYLVYGLTPLFVLMARHRDWLVNRWLALLPPLLFLLALAALPDLRGPLAALAHKPHEQALVAEAEGVLDWTYRLGTLSGLAALIGLLLWQRVAPWQRLVLAGLVQTLVVFGVVVPRVFALLQEPVREAALIARQLDRPTVVFQTSMPSFSVYRQAVTPPQATPQPGHLVFLRIDKLPRLTETVGQAQLMPIYQRGAVALVQVVAPPPLGAGQ